MSATSDDTLDGFRGSPNRGADVEIEDELRWVNSLRESELNTELLRAIVVSDDLERELNNDSSTMRRLVNRVIQELDEATKAWQSQADPMSAVAILAHRKARAARVVIDWIQEVMDEATAAEKMLEEEST